jgi:hypothetical protein
LVIWGKLEGRRSWEPGGEDKGRIVIHTKAGKKWTKIGAFLQGTLVYHQRWEILGENRPVQASTAAFKRKLNCVEKKVGQKWPSKGNLK